MKMKPTIRHIIITLLLFIAITVAIHYAALYLHQRYDIPVYIVWLAAAGIAASISDWKYALPFALTAIFQFLHPSNSVESIITLIGIEALEFLILAMPLILKEIEFGEQNIIIRSPFSQQIVPYSSISVVQTVFDKLLHTADIYIIPKHGSKAIRIKIKFDNEIAQYLVRKVTRSPASIKASNNKP